MKNQAFPPKNPRKSADLRQSGNILFLIFIAVALFGALSFAMMKGNRANTGLFTGEQAKLAAAEIVQYGTQIRDATKTLRVNGIPLEQISFQMSLSQLQNGNPIVNDMLNSNCTSNKCKIFHAEGGAVKERHFYDYGIPDSWWQSTWARTGGIEFVMMNVKNVGTSAPEIAIKINQIERNVCRAINRLLGVPEDSRIWFTSTNYYPALPANFGVTDAMDAGYNADTAFAGKMFFCDMEDRTVFIVIVPR